MLRSFTKICCLFVSPQCVVNCKFGGFCLELKSRAFGVQNEFRNWDSVLSTLFLRPHSNWLVLVIDDVQYLFDSAPKILAFAKYAQKYKKQLRLSVIFRSAFAEMERVLLKNQEMQIKITLMKYKIRRYGLLGSTAIFGRLYRRESIFIWRDRWQSHYMSYLDAELSFKDNLKNCF